MKGGMWELLLPMYTVNQKGFQIRNNFLRTQRNWILSLGMGRRVWTSLGKLLAWVKWNTRVKLKHGGLQSINQAPKRYLRWATKAKEGGFQTWTIWPSKVAITVSVITGVGLEKWKVPGNGNDSLFHLKGLTCPNMQASMKDTSSPPTTVSAQAFVV